MQPRATRHIAKGLACEALRQTKPLVPVRSVKLDDEVPSVAVPIHLRLLLLRTRWCRIWTQIRARCRGASPIAGGLVSASARTAARPLLRRRLAIPRGHRRRRLPNTAAAVAASTLTTTLQSPGRATPWSLHHRARALRRSGGCSLQED
jgi:hypothetical protein